LKNFIFHNPRWRTAAILETVKSPYLRNHLTDFDGIWHDDADWPPTGDISFKFPIFQKNKMAAAAILKKPQKSRYHNKGLTDLRKIWQDYAKLVS